MKQASATAAGAPPRAFGMQSLLMGLPAITVVPLLLLAAVLLYVMAGRAKDEAWGALAADTQELAREIEREVASAAKLLAVLSEAPVLQAEPPDLERFDAYARRAIDPIFRLESIAILDRDGRRLMDSLQPSQAREGLSPVTLQLVQRQVFETERPAISQLYESPISGRLSVSINVPVIRDGRPRWVMSARLGPEHFTGLLAEHAARSDRVVTLFDGNNRLIARSREAERHFGRTASPPALQALQSGPSGAVEFESFEGSLLMWSWQRLPSGWTVLVGTPAAVYKAQLYTSMARLAAAGLGALAIGLAAAALLGRRITRSVSTMGESASTLLEGRDSGYRWSGVRQLDALHRTLQLAGSRLAAAVAERSRAMEAKRVALDAERAARAEAEAANRAKDEFLAMLSHELRNPLPPIVNMVKLLGRSEPLTDQGRQAVGVIARQVEHLKRLVDDLMEATRVTKGMILLQLRPVDVAAVIEEAVEAARASGEGQDRRITLEIAPGLGHIQADPVRIKQVLENVLGNAIKYSRGGDAIHVEAAGDADGVEIRVRDEGVGIDPEHLSRIFGLFVQLDATIDRARGGLGIGLALVRALVQMHGGRVRAESEGKGRGATFAVWLPRQVPLDMVPPVVERPPAPRRRVSDTPTEAVDAAPPAPPITPATPQGASTPHDASTP